MKHFTISRSPFDHEGKPVYTVALTDEPRRGWAATYIHDPRRLRQAAVRRYYRRVLSVRLTEDERKPNSARNASPPTKT